MGAMAMTFQVGDDDTAISVGSGSLPVLATPRLLAWFEAATVVAASPAVLDCEEGTTTVGTRAEIEHCLPTAVGGEIEVFATLASREDGVLVFEVTAVDRHGNLVGSGRITRVVVSTGRFLNRLPPI